eukprot:gb/GECH01008908.1/.p1 GENE.gb/GECH01008908.1/~~gb/GECH01008908.1/.p1  ORF type:complete len:352 (+),score=15.19 gb/GECH01008908.1/:1-1056(+)
MPWSLGIDSMHMVFLGLTRHMFDLFLSPRYHNKPWHLIVNQRNELNNLVKLQRFPSIFHRKLDKIDGYKTYKATQLPMFAFYLWNAVSDVIPSVYFKHFKKMYDGIKYLSSNKIKRSELAGNHKQLVSCVVEHEELFGPENMNSKVHDLFHITKAVDMCGPLWTFSAFPFEHFNGILSNMVPGTHNCEDCVTRACSFLQALPELETNITEPHVNEFLQRTSSTAMSSTKHNWKKIYTDCYVIGKGKKIGSNIRYYKLFLKGVMIKSSEKYRNSPYDDSIISFHSNNSHCKGKLCYVEHIQNEFIATIKLLSDDERLSVPVTSIEPQLVGIRKIDGSVIGIPFISPNNDLQV